MYVAPVKLYSKCFQIFRAFHELQENNDITLKSHDCDVIEQPHLFSCHSFGHVVFGGTKVERRQVLQLILFLNFPIQCFHFALLHRKLAMNSHSRCNSY